MLAKIRSSLLTRIFSLLLIYSLLGVNPVMAQFFDEGVEQDDLFQEDSDAFFESTTDEFGQPTSLDQDFTEGNKYIDEGATTQRSLTIQSRRLQLKTTGERDILPLNMAWGAGTGLLIGGWFALISEGDNRQTQRSIGLGIVLGIMLGTAVGTRSIFSGSSPVANSEINPESQPAPSNLTPLVTLGEKEKSVGFRLVF